MKADASVKKIVGHFSSVPLSKFWTFLSRSMSERAWDETRNYLTFRKIIRMESISAKR